YRRYAQPGSAALKNTSSGRRSIASSKYLVIEASAFTGTDTAFGVPFVPLVNNWMSTPSAPTRADSGTGRCSASSSDSNVQPGAAGCSPPTWTTSHGLPSSGSSLLAWSTSVMTSLASLPVSRSSIAGVANAVNNG